MTSVQIFVTAYLLSVVFLLSCFAYSIFRAMRRQSKEVESKNEDEENGEGIKVGSRIPVNDPDHARMVIANLCMSTGKMVMGEAEWNDDGTGFVIITSMNDV